MVFVPTILWTAQVFLVNIPSLYQTSVLNVNAATIGTVAYGLYYIALHRKLGMMVAPVLTALLYAAFKFHNSIENANKIALGIHIFSWVMQIRTLN